MKFIIIYTSLNFYNIDKSFLKLVNFTVLIFYFFILGLCKKFSASLDKMLYLYELITLLCNNQYISPVFQVNCTFYHKMILVLIKVNSSRNVMIVCHWMMFLPMCHRNKLINSLLIFCKFTCCLCCYNFHRSL